MKTSQKVVVSALSGIVLLMIVGAALIWVGLLRQTVPSAAVPAAAGGDRITRDFALENFRRVDVSGAWKVTLARGAQWQVRLTFPQSMASELRPRVEGDRLILDHRSSGWRLWDGDATEIDAYVVMPDLEGVDLSGSTRLALSGFDGERLSIRVSGAANVEGRNGRYEELALSVSGAGKVNLRGVSVVDADVNLAGASDVTLSMNGGVLSGKISGAGKVDYYGNVREQSVGVSGIGKINRAGP